MEKLSRTPVFITSPTWQMNGVNVFARNLVEGLTQKGFEASVVLTNPRMEEPIPLSVPAGLNLIDLATRPSDPVIRRWRALMDFLERNRPCVYIPNYDWHTSCVAPRLSREVAIVGIVHSDDPRHYEHFQRLGHTWNAVVAVSNTIGEQIRKMEPAISSRLAVIPIGVHLAPQRKRAVNREGPLRILYFGLLNQFQKRILDVPEILKAAIDGGLPITLTFAGGGDDESLVREKCRNFEAQGLVRFAGILGRAQLSHELDNHDVFLMTSEFEGLPNSLLEAMAHSLVPVVTAVASGIPEVIRDGNNGFIVPIGDITAFADRLRILHQDRNIADRMAIAARETVANGPYRVDRMVHSYADVIERVAKEARTGSFNRPHGPFLPPSDLGPLWRHYIPQPVRSLWRRLRGPVNHD